MKVFIIADIYESCLELSSEAKQEWESEDSILFLEKTIQSLGYETKIIQPSVQAEELLQELQKALPYKNEVILFNLVEGYLSRSREALVPALAELLGFPYTGSNAYLQCLTLDKFTTSSVVRSLQIPTPHSLLVTSFNNLRKHHLSYPLFIKPNHEGSSIGVSSDNIIYDVESLERVGKALLEKYTIVLLEEYLSGTDITCGIFGNYPNYQLTEVASIGYDSLVYSALIKTKDEMPETLHFNLSQKLSDQIKKYCLCIAKHFQIQGYARLDFKLNSYHEPFFLEINLTPGLSYRYSSLPLCYLHSLGTYSEMVKKILFLSTESKKF